MSTLHIDEAATADAGAGRHPFISRETLQFLLPKGAPGFLCPSCQCALQYEGSRAESGSDRPIELSDIYSCPVGCGTYEHARQTHRLRLVSR